MYVTLQSSTCFEHQHAHLQEDKKYYHRIWYRHSLYSRYRELLNSLWSHFIMVIYFMQDFQETVEEEEAEYDNTVRRTVTGSRGGGRKGMEKITKWRAS